MTVEPSTKVECDDKTSKIFDDVPVSSDAIDCETSWSCGVYAHPSPLFSPKEPAQTMMLRPWADEVEQLSKGKVKLNIAPGMSLGGKPSDLVKQAREGKFVDLIWTINGHSGKEFLRSEVFELPFVHTPMTP